MKLITTLVAVASVAAHQVKLPMDYNAWSRVATCEEGGWYAPGGNYPDALGIDYVNWRQFGGNRTGDHGYVSRARRVFEIRIADRIRARYGISIPDQGHCAAW